MDWLLMFAKGLRVPRKAQRPRKDECGWTECERKSLSRDLFGLGTQMLAAKSLKTLHIYGMHFG